jgi:hypothetical protein
MHSPLSDITNTPIRKRTKRLVDGTVKTYVTPRKPRMTIELVFDNEAQKLEFGDKLSKVKELMGITRPVEVMSQLVDKYLHKAQYSSDTSNRFMKNEDSVDDLESFICTKKQLLQLVQTVQQRPCELYDFVRNGHVGELLIRDIWSDHQWTWASSPWLKDNYTLNYKLLHASLCTGLLAVQFDKLCKFANIGNTTDRFKLRFYPLYSQVCMENASNSMQTHLNSEVHAANGQGISIATDARHACRKNSYHSDVIAIGFTTHRVISHQHVTKDDERSSQKHEAFGTEKMYEEFHRRNIKVAVHAHDRNGTISNIVARQDGTVDGLDTWHASKEVKNAVTKVSKGALKNSGVTWHPQLSDKVSGVKTHTYYSMKNCGGNPLTLKNLLDNIPKHYKNEHTNCPPTSRCKTEANYVASRLIINEDIAETLLRKVIQGLFMYRHPEKYTRCVDTHYVESFNNVVLVYADKRVHYGNTMYALRLNLAILDWNENVDRPASSLKHYQRAKNPRSIAPTRVLRRKTFNFVMRIWDAFVAILRDDQRLPEADDAEVVEEIVDSDSDLDDNDNDNDNE